MIVQYSSSDGLTLVEPDGESWQKSYLAMIEAARKHGWIDAQAGAIRAHIERSA
jgi:hypothetical protein